MHDIHILSEQHKGTFVQEIQGYYVFGCVPYLCENEPQRVVRLNALLNVQFVLTIVCRKQVVQNPDVLVRL